MINKMWGRKEKLCDDKVIAESLYFEFLIF